MNIPANIQRLLIWATRVAVGALFVFSGFAKLVDPWGGMYKIQEYLAVWGVHFVPRSMIFIAAFALGALEFVSGVSLMLGLMRRLVPRILMALMCVLLPLSLYIVLFDPVSECGCFGDAWHISNTATFVKNIIIVGLLVYLLRRNTAAQHPFHPLTQWMVVFVSFVYALVLSICGYVVQPLVDFRPYPVGAGLLPESNDDLKLIYKKGAVTRLFPADSLPDDEWEYLGVSSTDGEARQLAFFDGDEDVTEAVLSDADPTLILFVADTRRHGLARGAMANKLARLIRGSGGDMVAVVAESDSVSAHRWARGVNAEYDVYTADDTQIKEVVRGDAALVYLEGDTIRWKANLYSFPGDFPQQGAKLESVRPIERSLVLPVSTAIYLMSLLVIFLGRYLIRKRTK